MMTTRTQKQAGNVAAMANTHRPAFSRLCEWASSVDAEVAYLPERNPSRSGHGAPDSMSS